VLLCAACYAYKTVTGTEQGSFSKASGLGKLTEINLAAAQTFRFKAYNHQVVSEYNLWHNHTRAAFV